MPGLHATPATDMPAVGQMRPAVHGVTADAPDGQKLPAVHAAPTTDRPAVGQMRPAVQGVAIDMPVTGQNVPTGQFAATDMPVADTTLPTWAAVEEPVAHAVAVPMVLKTVLEAVLGQKNLNSKAMVACKRMVLTGGKQV